MSDAINLLQNVSTLDVSPLANGYTKVIINAGTDDDGNVITYEAGTDGGSVLTIDNPWGTQQMAENMLSRISGWQYQPYSAGGALLDPSAELGDGVTINGTYGGIFTQNTNFTSLMKAEISAPTNEEIEHEYTSAVESASDRAYSRLVKAVNTRISQNATAISLEAEARTASDEAINSQLNIQAGQISAKVEKQTQNAGSTSFGWILDESSWTIYNGSKKILYADQYGLHIEGEITADSGRIGKFDIKTDYLTYNNLKWEDTDEKQGIYLGTSGIRLGNSFKVDTGGNVTANSLTANNATLTGTLSVGGDTITAANLRTGAVGGNDWSTGTSGINTRTYATNFNTVSTEGATTGVYNGYLRFFGAHKIKSTNIEIRNGALYNPGNITFVDGNTYLRFYNSTYLADKNATKHTPLWKTTTITDYNGNPVTINYLGY